MNFSDILGGAVESITVETAYLPPIVISSPFAAGPPNPAAQFLRPKLSVQLAGQDQPLVIAPYGDPGPSAWPAVKFWGVAAAVGVLGYTALRLLSKR